MHEERHFWGNSNTWVNSDLFVVDILNLIHEAAAAVWPPATTFIATCIFFCFSGTVYTAVLHRFISPQNGIAKKRIKTGLDKLN